MFGRLGLGGYPRRKLKTQLGVELPGAYRPPGLPHLGLLGQAAWGYHPWGIVDPFWDENPPTPIPPYLIALGDRIGGFCKGGVLGSYQTFIFLFRKASTIPPRVITPTRPAPAGPDGGVQGGVAPPGARPPRYTPTEKSEVFFGGGCSVEGKPRNGIKRVKVNG